MNKPFQATPIRAHVPPPVPDVVPVPTPQHPPPSPDPVPPEINEPPLPGHQPIEDPTQPVPQGIIIR